MLISLLSFRKHNIPSQLHQMLYYKGLTHIYGSSSNQSINQSINPLSSIPTQKRKLTNCNSAQFKITRECCVFMLVLYRCLIYLTFISTGLFAVRSRWYVGTFICLNFSPLYLLGLYSYLSLSYLRF
jgi:hypothetical protein